MIYLNLVKIGVYRGFLCTDFPISLELYALSFVKISSKY